MMRSMLSLSLLAAIGCKKEDPPLPTDTDQPGDTDTDTDADTDTDTNDTDTDTDTDPPPPGDLSLGPATPQTLQANGTLQITATGVTDDQAYRVTLVHADNLTVNGDGTGVFVDADANGAADAGPSETVAQIYAVNYGNVTPAKTYPAATDNPANPTGIFPFQDEIAVGIQAVGGGTIYPVIYHNGGSSTFLEVDANGVPIETYTIGSAITVDAPPPPAMAMAPLTPTTIAVGETTTYTITGLDDTYAYRVTLVVDANITPDGTGMATFVDGDTNGAADAGPSETVAGLSDIDGSPVTPPAKTYPDPTDDPASPTGIYPTSGQITITVTGIGAGTVYPVAYRNGGTSTFLEIDPVSYAPVEDYTVGGSLTVQ